MDYSYLYVTLASIYEHSGNYEDAFKYYQFRLEKLLKQNNNH